MESIEFSPEILPPEKKYNKIRNLLSALSKEGKIKSSPGKLWVLDEV